MEKKLIETLKKILANPDMIASTYRSESEYYFRCKGIAMSVLKASSKRDAAYGPYSFYIYPKWTDGLNELAHFSSVGSFEEADMDMISFHMGHFANSEAAQYFESLYMLLQRKHSGVDLEDLFKKILD